MDVEEQRAAMEKVHLLARKLGLRGVIIMSPVCDGCGNCHDFEMLSDFSDARLSAILEEFADEAWYGEPDILSPSPAHNDH